MKRFLFGVLIGLGVGVTFGRFYIDAYPVAFAGVLAAFVVGAILSFIGSSILYASDFIALDRDRERARGEHVQEWTL